MENSETGLVSSRTVERSGVAQRAVVHHPAWALTALLGAMFLGNVDVAIANIAGPAIGLSMHASGGELALVVSGYTLTYTAVLATGARLGEARGYRRVFLVGLCGFTAASLACGLAPTLLVLVIARMLAGVAAALVAAQVLTGIQLGFDGRSRARALGLYSLVLSSGAVAGQSLGGLLISANILGATWRPAFLVNVPIALPLAWLAWRYLPAGQRQQRRLDLAGVALFSAAMLLLVVPLVLGPETSWPPWTWACLALSATAFAALWIVERTVIARGAQPLVDPRLLAQPTIGFGLASQAAATATYFALLFTLALYLQEGLSKSPTYSGLALVPWVAAFGLPGPILSRFRARVRTVAAPTGAVLLAAGYAALAASLYAGVIGTISLVALLGVAGLGLGIAFTGMLSHLTGSVSGEHAAAISGLFNTTTRAGGVIGTAVFGSTYVALVRDRHEAVHGFATVILAMAVTASAAAALAGLSIRNPKGSR